MLNLEVVALIEIASFQLFSDADINFIKKAGEGIALATSNINTDIQTTVGVKSQMGQRKRTAQEELLNSYL